MSLIFVLDNYDKLLKIRDDMIEMHTNKDHDYAEKEPLGNFRSSLNFNVAPWIGVLCRMGDKYNRIISVSSKNTNKVNEKLEDTLLDLSIYCLIDYILFEQWIAVRQNEPEPYLTSESEFKKFKELAELVPDRVIVSQQLRLNTSTYQYLTRVWLSLIEKVDANDEDWMYLRRNEIREALLKMSTVAVLYLHS
jgi:hypothetical protein